MDEIAIPQVPEVSPREKFSLKKVFFPLLIIVLLGGGLYVGLKLAEQSTEQRSRAAGADVKLLFVGPTSAVSGDQIQVPVLVDLSASSHKLSAVDLMISYPGNLLTFQKAEAGNFYLKNFSDVPQVNIGYDDLWTARAGATSSKVMLARIDISAPGSLKIALGAPCPRSDTPPLGSCETPSNASVGTNTVLLTLFFQVKTVASAQTATLSFTFPQSIAAGIAVDGTAVTTSVLSSALTSKAIAISPLVGPTNTPTKTPTRTPTPASSQRDVSSSAKGTPDGNVNNWDTGFIMQSPFPCGTDYGILCGSDLLKRDVSSSAKGTPDGNVNNWDTGFIMQSPFPCGTDYGSC